MAKRIVEYVDAVKVAPVSKDAEDVKFIQDVLAGLKANPGKDVKLDIEAKTREEAEKTVKKLMKLKKGMGLAFKNLVFEVLAEGESGFATKARLEKPARKSGKGLKKKSKASPANQQMDKEAYLGELKKLLETPEGRAKLEPIVKASGCQTAEEYIASVEKKMKG